MIFLDFSVQNFLYPLEISYFLYDTIKSYRRIFSLRGAGAGRVFFAGAL